VQVYTGRGRCALSVSLARGDGKRPVFLGAVMGFPLLPDADQQIPQHQAGAGRDRGVARHVQGARRPRLQVRGTYDRLRVHAGGRHGRRSPSEMSPARRMRQACQDKVAAVAKIPPKTPSGSPLKRTASERNDERAARAWQRMLSGRRLDLLDPSPLDVEIADIAHWLARVARWNRQTVGPPIHSCAQPTALSPALELDYLTPWPAGTAEKRFLERFAALARE